MTNFWDRLETDLLYSPGNAPLEDSHSSDGVWTHQALRRFLLVVVFDLQGHDQNDGGLKQVPP